jgi:hypothetical protein
MASIGQAQERISKQDMLDAANEVAKKLKSKMEDLRKAGDTLNMIDMFDMQQLTYDTQQTLESMVNITSALHQTASTAIRKMSG